MKTRTRIEDQLKIVNEAIRELKFELEDAEWDDPAWEQLDLLKHEQGLLTWVLEVEK